MLAVPAYYLNHSRINGKWSLPENVFRLFFRTVWLWFFPILFSCEYSVIVPDPAFTGQNFFPVSPQLYREYRVIEINYFGTGEIDTLIFYHYESIDSIYTDQGGDTVFVLRRLKKFMPDQKWETDSLFAIKKNSARVLVTENNIAYVKMVFPVSDNRQWDGNAYNFFDPEYYVYRDVDKTFARNDSLVENTVRIVQSDFIAPFVEEDIRTEVFARNIGLIYQERINLQYCTEPECFGEGIVSSGKIYMRILMNTGNE